MPTDPEFQYPQSLPPADAERPWNEETTASYPPPVFRLPRKPRHIPNFGHTLIFLIIAAVCLILTQIAAFLFAMGTHLFGRETIAELLRDPRLLIPTMAVSYLIAGAVAWSVFTGVWKEPFALGVRWNSALVRRRFYVFLSLGIALSVTVQLLSNFLPIPKALPIDEFFRTPTDVWMVAIFGTFIAPVFEELGFRGFIFPSLATAWDWFIRRQFAPPDAGNVIEVTPAAGAGVPGERSSLGWGALPVDPKWSTGAVVFSSIITSIGFALLHADQLAHSWAPLLILFGVSIVLCMVRLFAHSLAASTLVHATYNCTIFVLMFFATDGFRHLDKLNG